MPNEPVAADAAAKPESVKDSIKSFLADVASKRADLTAAKAELATAKESLAAAQAELATLKTRAETAEASLATAQTEAKNAKESLAAVCSAYGISAEDAAKPAADLQKVASDRITALATDKLQSLGFDPAKLPAASSSDKQTVRELTHAEFAQLTAHEKMDFCTKGGKITNLKLNN